MAHEIGFKKLFSNGFEKKVFNKLETWFLHNGSKVVHNCALPWASGKITEADIIMISKSGIFAFECKKWHGVITNDGPKYHKCIPHEDGIDFHKDCINPFYQNYLHILCLKKLLSRKLQINKIPFFSLVVFPDDCSIEGIHPEYSDNYPVHIKNNMIKTIKHIDATHPHVLSNQQIDAIYNFLKTYEPQTEEEKLSKVKIIKQQKYSSYMKNQNRGTFVQC